MPAGLTIYNAFGTVQIDQSWRNYGFRQRVPAEITAYATSPPNPAGYNGNLFRLTLSGTPALLVACRAATLLPVKLHSYYAGGTWTFNWLFLPPFAGTVTETVEFFVFDVMDGTYSNVGLEVFNEAGERVFHSDAPVMKVPAVQGCDAGFDGIAGRSYVPLIMRNPIFGINLGFPTGYRLASHCLRVSGSSIASTPSGSLGSFGASGEYANAGAYGAVDVTGLS